MRVTNVAVAAAENKDVTTDTGPLSRCSESPRLISSLDSVVSCRGTSTRVGSTNKPFKRKGSDLSHTLTHTHAHKKRKNGTGSSKGIRGRTTEAKWPD